ncbi:c-type cytochrome [Jannaschia formosa]|uniref:c-type cytochrome n=1 Tax=Jannaschia formosa TaxID=2259592 RepID=UPI001FD75B81|nr:c-type cytochrome [Jannaschia formosa]
MAFSTPLAAQDTAGDAEAGETYFGRQCVACHAIADDAGNVIAGSLAGMGPNLHGIVGDAPGSREGYDDYSDALVAYGETGVVWEESNIVAFLQNPSGHLREELDDSSARSKMSYRLRDEEEAHDVYAYLATFSDLEDEEGPEDEEGNTE